MAIHKLQLDDIYENEQFTLFGIHCDIEDYRLAYALNKALHINLHRKCTDVDAQGANVSYSIYEWVDVHQLITWHLVTNICKVEDDQLTKDYTMLPLASQITRTYYLIPEFKKVNFLLKVSSILTSVEQKTIIEGMQCISQIITAYAIQCQHIKSKNNLIFN